MSELDLIDKHEKSYMFTSENTVLDLYSFLKMGYFFNIDIGDSRDTVRKNMGNPKFEQVDVRYKWEDWYYDDKKYRVCFMNSKVDCLVIDYQYFQAYSLPIKVEHFGEIDTLHISQETLIGQMIQILNLKKFKWELSNKGEHDIFIIKTEGKVDISFNLDNDKLFRMTREQPQ
jgi:hypothetical protein